MENILLIHSLDIIFYFIKDLVMGKCILCKKEKDLIPETDMTACESCYVNAIDRFLRNWKENGKKLYGSVGDGE